MKKMFLTLLLACGGVSFGLGDCLALCKATASKHEALCIQKKCASNKGDIACRHSCLDEADELAFEPCFKECSKK